MDCRATLDAAEERAVFVQGEVVPGPLVQQFDDGFERWLRFRAFDGWLRHLGNIGPYALRYLVGRGDDVGAPRINRAAGHGIKLG